FLARNEREAESSASDELTLALHEGIDRDPERVLLELIRMFYNRGADIAWEKLYEGDARNRVSLPLYPFQRERHWPEETGTQITIRFGKPTAEGALPGEKATGNPFAGRELASPLTSKQFAYHLDGRKIPALEDHGGLVHMGMIVEMLAHCLHDDM